MIYTLTTNPAIDMNICSQPIVRDKVNRTVEAVYTPNGKGLNVSFVLDHFGMKSTILGFFGGFSGDYIVQESKKKGIPVCPVWIEDTTRINIFLNDSIGEYKLVNEGAYVSEEAQEELARQLMQLEDLDYLVISGSLSKGMEAEYYEKIMKICQKKDTKVILDISSPKLKALLPYRPYLIKPNDEEIDEIFGIKMRDEKDVVDVLGFLHEKGVQNILLTLGNKGSYFSNGKDIYYAGTYPVKLLSSACAGDSFLAAFLSVWLEHPENIEDAMKLASATGANVSESNAIGTLEKVDVYKKAIKVRKVK